MVAGLTLSPPTAFAVTGPVLMALAAAVAADWAQIPRTAPLATVSPTTRPRLRPLPVPPQVPATVGRRPHG